MSEPHPPEPGDYVLFHGTLGSILHLFVEDLPGGRARICELGAALHWSAGGNRPRMREVSMRNVERVGRPKLSGPELIRALRDAWGLLNPAAVTPR